MEQLKLSEINIEKIKSREFQEVLPELYELEEITENNPWHNNDVVLKHTISTLIELEKLVKKSNDKIKEYLGEKINIYSRGRLLLLAALFHDIAKKDTFQKHDDLTKCLGHEEKGAEKLKEIIKRFDLSEKEQQMVIQIVKNHGIIHDILLSSPEQVEYFKKQHFSIFLEIILLAVADMSASQLKDLKPEEFRLRLTSLNKILDNYF